MSVAAARIVIQPLVSDGASQVLGSAVIAPFVGACSVCFLRPAGRNSTLWERILGYVFPSIAVVSGFYAWSKFYDEPAPPALLFWLLTGIAVSSFKIGGFIDLATKQMDSLRAEAERTRNAQSQFEAHYREITEQTSDMISEIDDRDQFVYANPAHETILGFRPQSLIGTSAGFLWMSEDSVPEPAHEAMKSLQRIVVARHNDGQPVTRECNIRPFVLANGERRRIITSRDVTARVASERENEAGRIQLEALVEERTDELRSSLRELQNSQRLASMGTMAAGIAHQINNPIGSIQMSAEYALSVPTDDADYQAASKEALTNSVEQATRCGRIVASMLQFARNEPTKKSREDVSGLVKLVCEQADRYAKGRGASIEMLGLDDSLYVWGSAIELEQAILNLVRNATESSEDAVRVIVRAERLDDRARVTVSDDGCGMTEVEVDRIFDPFFTTRLGRGGTGLGLSVAHGVIADHRGQISVESSPGIGSLVTISLPLHDKMVSTI